MPLFIPFINVRPESVFFYQLDKEQRKKYLKLKEECVLYPSSMPVNVFCLDTKNYGFIGKNVIVEFATNE